MSKRVRIFDGLEQLRVNARASPLIFGVTERCAVLARSVAFRRFGSDELIEDFERGDVIDGRCCFGASLQR